jgi:hypothetical protein
VDNSTSVVPENISTKVTSNNKGMCLVRNFLAQFIDFCPVVGLIAIADAVAKLALIGGGLFFLCLISKQRLVNNLKSQLNMETKGRKFVILLLMQLFSQGNARKYSPKRI